MIPMHTQSSTEKNTSIFDVKFDIVFLLGGSVVLFEENYIHVV